MERRGIIDVRFYCSSGLDDLNDTPSVVAIGSAPRIIARADHNISRSNISGNALRVLYRLKEAGYQAFLVGGCVRDVMLGAPSRRISMSPPTRCRMRCRSLFRNSRLVGRRFRLAHIVFGREVIEVATFRAARRRRRVRSRYRRRIRKRAKRRNSTKNPSSMMNDQRHDHERVLDTHGRLLRDNVYGSIEEDVWRRDFTANALYYNIADFSFWDYVGGAEDIAAHRLRLIGDPETRYREDPGAHAAGGALRGQAWLCARAVDRRSRLRACARLLAGVPAGATVR